MTARNLIRAPEWPKGKRWDNLGWVWVQRQTCKSPGLRWRAEFVPRRVAAGGYRRLRLVVSVGRPGLHDGGKIYVKLPPQWLAQVTHPRKTNYVEAELKTKRKPASMRLTMHREVKHFTGGLLECVYSGQALRPGDKVILHFGARTSLGLRIQDFAGRAEFFTVVDARGDESRKRLAKQPVLKVTGNSPKAVKLVVQGVAALGRKTLATVSVRDALGNPACDYEGVLELREANARGARPLAAKLRKRDGGVKRVTLPPVKSPGIRYYAASDKSRGLAAKSNPVRIGGFDGGYRVYFGDIHVHSALSDGYGAVEDFFDWCRSEALDFAALSEHAEPNRCHQWPWTNARWRAFKDLMRERYIPNRFVPLLGFEWTSTLFGHRNVYYRTDDGPLLASCDPRCDTPEKLWSRLAGTRALIIPHHPVEAEFKWDNHRNDELERLVEVFSHWGNSEEGPSSVQYALNAGRKLGITGGSDNHLGRPACANKDYRTARFGLTAVFAPRLTREAVFDGLWQRRCYATSGPRILLHFTANGVLMGGTLPRNDRADIHIGAAGTAPLRKVEVIRNGEVILDHSAGGWVAELDFRDAPPKAAESYYYVRITQEDGEMAWSSPVWLTPGNP